MIIQIYLKMERRDLALKEIKEIRRWADDATLAYLMEAWINIVTKFYKRDLN